MMADVDTDIFLKKTRDAGEGAPGRNPILIYEFFFTAEQFPLSQLPVCLDENYKGDERHTSIKKFTASESI